MDKQELLNAIKSDDLIMFSKIVNDNPEMLSLRYGRFPLLSLIYLYKSNRIIKNYEDTLSKIKTYTNTSEDISAYRLFKKHAKRALRLYVFSDNIVTPLEMLAVLGESERLYRNYTKQNKDNTVTENIISLYRMLHKQKVKEVNNNLILKRNYFAKLPKLVIVLLIVITCLTISISGTALGTIYDVFGSGDETNPIKVFSEKQLVEVMQTGERYYQLERDITLTEKWEANDFFGTLLGNGHTVFVSDKMTDGFINNLNGRIENIKFVFGELHLNVVNNTSFLVNTNNGIINKISITMQAELTDILDEETLFVSCFVHENNGTISNCALDTNIVFEGNGSGDTFLTGIVSWNNGEVTGCLTTDNSVFTTDKVDVSGIVLENGANGSVTDCENNASLSQTSASTEWLPNVGGVVLRNFGIVSDCNNNGLITAESTANDNNLDIYAAGIIAINHNSVTRCKNNADIIVISSSFHIYAGGVVAVNNLDNSIIDNCCSYGVIAISAESEEGNYLFAGGIVGYLIGTIKDSYSAMTITNENANSYLGGVAGIAISNAVSINNYYVDRENIVFGIGTILFFNTLYEGVNSGVTTVTSSEELIALEVYWE